MTSPQKALVHPMTKPEDSPERSTEMPSPPPMSWVERHLAEGTWRYRVKYWTKSQRRERVMQLMRLRNPPSGETWAVSPSTD